MSSKKKNTCPSANPELYQKSLKPSMTVAMGMKSNHTAAACWRAQIESEERLHTTWAHKYNKKEEKKRIEALQRTLQRETDKHNAYHEGNTALQDILYRKDAANPRCAAKTYLEVRKKLAPQEKYNKPQTAAQDVGWAVPAAMRNENHFASTRMLNPAVRMQQMATAYRRPDDQDHAELFGYTLERSY